MPQAPRPANLGPRHNWCRYLSFVALFLMAHIVAHFSFGGMSSGWNILSAGAFGLALGVPIGQAECCPVLCTILALCVCIERCLSDSPHAGTTPMDTRLCSSYVLPSLAASACCWVPSPFGFRGPGFLKCSHKVTSTPRRGANEAMRAQKRGRCPELCVAILFLCRNMARIKFTIKKSPYPAAYSPASPADRPNDPF